MYNRHTHLPLGRQTSRQTNRQTGGQAVHMLLLMIGIYSILPVSRSNLWAVCVQPSVYVCAFALSWSCQWRWSSIVFLFQSHLDICNSAILFIALALLCTNLSSSSSLSLSRLQTLFARFDEALNSGNMALSPSHGQLLFSFILTLLHWPLGATKFSRVIKMILLLSGIGCVFKVCVCVCLCQWVRVWVYLHVLLWLC